jgi:hypothetical protein
MPGTTTEQLQVDVARGFPSELAALERLSDA